MTNKILKTWVVLIENKKGWAAINARWSKPQILKLGGWEVFLSFPLSFGQFSGANS